MPERSAGSLLTVSNPATGAPCGEVRAYTAPDVDDTVGRARQAQPAWAALPFAARGAALRKLMRQLVRDPALVDALTAETGKPRFEAEGIELLYTLELTRFLSSRAGQSALAERIRRPFLFRTKRARVIYHPRGVIGVIGPWNWPLLNNFADAIPALLAGNAAILKPSQQTPLTSLRVEQIWKQLALPDVFHVITGGGRGTSGAYRPATRARHRCASWSRSS